MRLTHLWWVALALQALAAARGETWRTVNGDSWSGRLSGVYGPIAVFAEQARSRQVAVELLDEEALGRVADFLAAQKSGPAWAAAQSPVAKAFRNRLQVLRRGEMVPVDTRELPEPEIYLIYFGALWCGPCVRFSPELLQAYERLKVAAGRRFELVFVSSDRSASEQIEYVKKVGMSFPVLKFSAVGSAPVVERWRGRGIPCLVALTRDGEVIFHSYRGEEYLGPRHVLEQVTGLLAAMDVQPDESMKRARHRLAIVQHVRAAADGRAAPQPYVIAFDRTRHRTLEAKELLADLEIDAQGRVTHVAFEPKLDAVVEYQLLQVAQTWLFLPAVEQGRPEPRRVKLPLKF